MGTETGEESTFQPLTSPEFELLAIRVFRGKKRNISLILQSTCPNRIQVDSIQPIRLESVDKARKTRVFVYQDFIF